MAVLAPRNTQAQHVWAFDNVFGATWLKASLIAYWGTVEQLKDNIAPSLSQQHRRLHLDALQF